MAGALDQKKIKPHYYSYEGPFGVGYKFVAKNPHACVWDESHISLDKYLEK